MPYPWKVAQMCIFSRSTWKGANKAGLMRAADRRDATAPHPCLLISLMKAFVQLHWCRQQVLLEGLLATRLWPGDDCPDPNATGHREWVRHLEQLLWAAPWSTDIYCLCFSTKSSSVFNSIIWNTHAKAHWGTWRDLLLKHLSESLRYQFLTFFFQDIWRYATAHAEPQPSGLVKSIGYIAWKEISGF